MNGSNISIDKLVGDNYSYWRQCVEAYLQGQDLWELVSGEDVIPADTPQNAELRRKWKIKCGKALFALQTLVSKDYIEHVRGKGSPKEVWRHLRSCSPEALVAQMIGDDKQSFPQVENVVYTTKA
nr:UBN2_3 domain-containing protein [Ipomoea batatas]